MLQSVETVPWKNISCGLPWKNINSFHLQWIFCLNRLFSAEIPYIVLTHVLYCRSAVAHALQFPWSFGLNKSIFSKGMWKKIQHQNSFFQHFYLNRVWMVGFWKIWQYWLWLLIIYWAHQVLSINHQHCSRVWSIKTPQMLLWFI